MPTDEELYELWDTASTVKTSSFEPDVFDHAKGLRAVYEAGQAAATAAERERIEQAIRAEMLMDNTGDPTDEGYNMPLDDALVAIRADREPEPATEADKVCSCWPSPRVGGAHGYGCDFFTPATEEGSNREG